MLESISEGMTHDEVNEALGRPAGDYRTESFVEPPETSLHYFNYKVEERTKSQLEWICNEGRLIVAFDVNNKVIGVNVLNLWDNRPKSIGERFRRFAQSLQSRLSL
jgi:hypothetical protein